MFKVNNRNIRTRCEISSKSTINTPCSSVYTVNFEQVNAGWLKTVGLHPWALQEDLYF